MISSIRKTILFLIWGFAEMGFAQEPSLRIPAQLDYLDPSSESVSGILGEAIAKSRKGRIRMLPEWNDGELITMFSKAVRSGHDKTDWYGEHAGKWMYTAAIAARQSGDEQLKNVLLKTADYLIATQEDNGYLGTYSANVRITSTEASHVRSWDAWNLSYMTLGLLQINRFYPDPKYINAANKIGELFLATFGEGGEDITLYGTRHGISATVILDPVIELYKTTKDNRYISFAELIVKRMEQREGLKLVSTALHEGDMENVGDGKAYQILWNLTALVKLAEVTGNMDYLNAAKNAWQNIKEYHLSITGGPWGGIGKHKECFNSKFFWNPYGFVETCSTMSWIQLNKELLHVTGEAKYAQEIERAAYNALMGAQYPNGVDWSYHVFSNGSRHIAHFNDCCPSSGAMALEEIASGIYGRRNNGISVNLFAASEVQFILNKNKVKVIQKTSYPFSGNIQLTVSAAKKENFPLYVRIPDWADNANIKVNGEPVTEKSIIPGEFYAIQREWNKEDHVEISFPMELRVVSKTEMAGAPQGGRDIYDVSWIALVQGPIVFATNGLINGKDREKTLQLTGHNLEEYFTLSITSSGMPTYNLKAPDNEGLTLVPYYEAGEGKSGNWRLTWLQNKID